MFRQFVFACCFTIAVVFCATAAFAGKVELTTYYPAPYGEYQCLRSGKGDATSGDNTLHGYAFGTDGDTGMFATGSGAGGSAIYFSNDNTERMRIANNGNVGIGTANPKSKLSVSGGCAIGSAYAAIPHSDGYLSVSGNVGIGTTTPMWPLTVVGTIKGDTLFGYTLLGKGAVKVEGSVSTYSRTLAVDNSNGTLYFSYGGNHPQLTPAGVWAPASDVAYKENIMDINYGLDTVLAMRPRKFDYKLDHKKAIGFIAQEMEKIVPEVVFGEDGKKTLDYGALTAILTQAIQQQQKEMNGFQTQIDLLKKEIAELKKR